MKFSVLESTYYNQGTEKAFACTDDRLHRYYIPRSQVKIIERIEPEDKYGTIKLIIDVPDWIIRNNLIPVFRITELDLIR